MYSVSSSQCLSFTRFVVDPKSFFFLSTKKLVIALASGYVPAGYSHPSSSHVAMTDGCVPMRSLQHKRSAAGLALDSSRTYVQTLRSARSKRASRLFDLEGRLFDLVEGRLVDLEGRLFNLHGRLFEFEGMRTKIARSIY